MFRNLKEGGRIKADRINRNTEESDVCRGGSSVAFSPCSRCSLWFEACVFQTRLDGLHSTFPSLLSSMSSRCIIAWLHPLPLRMLVFSRRSRHNEVPEAPRHFARIRGEVPGDFSFHTPDEARPGKPHDNRTGTNPTCQTPPHTTTSSLSAVPS